LNSPAQDQALNNIIADGAKLEKVADGFSFTEGPTADKKGDIYFTDQPNNKILNIARKQYSQPIWNHAAVQRDGI